MGQIKKLFKNNDVKICSKIKHLLGSAEIKGKIRGRRIFPTRLSTASGEMFLLDPASDTLQQLIGIMRS
jgi:hypothetical protein